MNITVLGAGNIGTLLAAHLALNNKVNLYTNHKYENDEISVYDKDDTFLFSSKLNVTDDLSCISSSELIFVTYPTNIWINKVNDVEKHINKNSYIIFVPGTGGKEYFSQKILDSSTIIGMQRVPYISRLKEKGKSVYQLDIKKELFIGAINLKNKNFIKKIEKLMEIKCTYLDNYLTITLTPSNPILHTTRIYSMFKNKAYYNHKPLFYKEWDINSAEILLKCDEELQKICKKLDKLDLSGVKSLKEHYESNTAEELVNKIKSIESFKKITAPVIEKNGKYYPDFNSRYFKEDFPFGLLIIKGFSQICNIETPNIDEVIIWYQSKVNKKYLVDHKLIGKNINETGIPQNFNLTTKDEIYKFYNNYK